MKNFFSCLFILLLGGTAFGQRQSGLLWEISGNGLTKPSYVYGTMHVSDKVAFHLGDPFFKAIQSVDIVALEQNLDSVYDEWIKVSSSMIKNTHSAGSLDHSTFELNEYDKNDIANVLQVGPYLSNAILYRVNQIQREYQEETYLDMLIYRLAKKYKKQFAGVEDFLEAERLTSLATAKRTRRKDAIGDDDGEALSDFYRRGDLTAIDSMNKVQYTESYNDYMLYRRNKNMVAALKKLMAKGSVFCGVGCAHLPGKDGVLKLLEGMGYTIKPIKSMALKPSKYLEKSKKIKVATPLSPQISSDNFFSANLPGKIQTMFRQNINSTLYVSLDVPAGGQYLVYRYQDFPELRNKSALDVLKSIDSFLYETLSGKNDRQTVIKDNEALGRQSIGFDIEFTSTNGDKGRYKLFHTGSELVFVSVTGNKDFATGKEATDFFNSFKLLNANIDKIKPLSTPDGIFTFQAPAAASAPEKLQPIRSGYPDFNYNRTVNGGSYITLYRSLYNDARLNPDTTELLLSCESFAYSNKLKQESSIYKTYNGYPARYATYSDKLGNKFAVRVVLKGFKYLLQAKKGTADFSDAYFTSLEIHNPQIETEEMEARDTFAHFSAMVNGPDSRDQLSKQLELIREEQFFLENSQFAGISRLSWFSPDNDAEFVEINYSKFHRYINIKDSASFWDNYIKNVGYTDLQILSHKKTNYDYGTRMDVVMGDTGSSRRILACYILHGQEFVSATGFYDTVSGMGNFTKKFMESFRPVVSSTGSIFKSKVPLWVNDINSADSTMRRKAWNGFDNLYVDSNNVDYLVKVYDTMHTSAQLVDHKRNLISHIGFTKCQRMIPVLTKIYQNAGDTSAYQTAVISGLASLKSKASYSRLKELFFEETPVPDNKYNFNIMHAINDSLKLAATVFPDLFDKINMEEFKDDIIDFAAMLVDSNLLKPEVYASKVELLVREAGILVKKVLSTESSQNDKSEDNGGSNYTMLANYIKLLAPFKTEPKVKNFLDKVKTVKQRDNRLQYYVLLLKNNYPVEDSVFNNLASERNYKADLYRALSDAKLEAKFPKFATDKASFSRDAYYSEHKTKYVSGTATEIDSIFVIDSAVVKYYDPKAKQTKDGKIYLVKYNRKKKKSSYEESEDNEDKEKGPDIMLNVQYYYAIAGPQPLEKDSFNGTRMLMNSNKDRPVEMDSKTADEFIRLIRMGQIGLISPGFYGFDFTFPFYSGDEG